MAGDATMWSIGGLDPSGGAGLTRDCITTHQLGVHTHPIATMFTVQSPEGNTVYSQLATFCVDISFLNEQLTSQQASPPSSIKIGALANDTQADVIITTLIAMKSANPILKVVFDPVMKTTSGLQLSACSRNAIFAMLPYIDVITPNIDELSWLTTYRIDNEDAAKHAALELIKSGVPAVLIKGGHAKWDTDATDWLVTANQQTSFKSTRLKQVNLRGSGCRLASALGAAFAKGHMLEDAVCLAKSMLAFEFNCCASPQSSLPDNSLFNNHLPIVDSFVHSESFPRLTDVNIGLYPVVDSVAWVKSLLHTGINILQLRIKGRPANLLSQIQEAVLLAQDTGCQLFINDHWQEAIEAGAYGVHLGQDDLMSADLSAIAKAGLRLGVSTHGYFELARSLPLKPSYIALGHIFPTTTKVMPSAPQGLERLAEYVKRCGDIPTVAIGGISADKINAVAKTGVSGIAVVSAIVKASDPLQATRELQHMLLQEHENVN